MIFSIFSVIELACGEYGDDKIQILKTKAENGRALEWFNDPESIPSMESLRKQFPLSVLRNQDTGPYEEETSQSNQRSVLIKRGFLKAKRDSVRAHINLLSEYRYPEIIQYSIINVVHFLFRESLDPTDRRQNYGE